MRHLKIRISTFVITLICMLAILSSFNTDPIWACECAVKKSPKDEFKWATSVFVGEVSSLKTENNTVTVEVKVETVWKGQVSQTTFVETSKWKQACGFKFSVGNKYLIYTGGENPINVSRCGRTALLDSAEDDLKELGEGKTPE